MMAPSKRLPSVLIKVERARKHLEDLDVEVQSFFSRQPFQSAARRDQETREVIYYASKVEAVPPIIPAITADVLRNLRIALDYLACELVISSGKYPTRNTGFPIFSSAGVYKAQAAAKVQGMRNDAIAAIDGLTPYGGGNSILWDLQGLSNVDKHRLPNIDAIAYRFEKVTPNVLAYLRKTWTTRPGAWPEPEAASDPLIEYERKHRPLRKGDVLFIDLPDSKIDTNASFSYDLAFGETKFGYGLPLRERLKEMATTVDSVVLSLTGLLD
jgi:hypothetical protein